MSGHDTQHYNDLADEDVDGILPADDRFEIADQLAKADVQPPRRLRALYHAPGR